MFDWRSRHGRCLLLHSQIPRSSPFCEGWRFLLHIYQQQHMFIQNCIYWNVFEKLIKIKRNSHVTKKNNDAVLKYIVTAIWYYCSCNKLNIPLFIFLFYIFLWHIGLLKWVREENNNRLLIEDCTTSLNYENTKLNIFEK